MFLPGITNNPQSRLDHVLSTKCLFYIYKVIHIRLYVRGGPTDQQMCLTALFAEAIHRSAWKAHSANVACRWFSEVRKFPRCAFRERDRSAAVVSTRRGCMRYATMGASTKRQTRREAGAQSHGPLRRRGGRATEQEALGVSESSLPGGGGPHPQRHDFLRRVGQASIACPFRRTVAAPHADIA